MSAHDADSCQFGFPHLPCDGEKMTIDLDEYVRRSKNEPNHAPFLTRWEFDNLIALARKGQAADLMGQEIDRTTPLLAALQERAEVYERALREIITFEPVGEAARIAREALAKGAKL